MYLASEVPESFERDQGIAEADWLRCLPGAVRGLPLERPAPGLANVRLGDGTLTIAWTVLPPRRIALMSVPRLAVRYRFEGVDAETRRVFMRHFDLYTQRGGG